MIHFWWSFSLVLTFRVSGMVIDHHGTGAQFYDPLGNKIPGAPVKEGIAFAWWILGGRRKAICSFDGTGRKVNRGVLDLILYKLYIT